MTDLIAELRTMLGKATPGPWTAAKPERKGDAWPNGVIVAATARGLGIYASADGATFPAADRALLVALRNAAPALLDALEDRDKRIAGLEAMLVENSEAISALQAETVERAKLCERQAAEIQRLREVGAGP